MKTIVYDPTKYAKLGIKIWPEMVKELLKSRELIWRLFVRDLSGKYKQAVLGYVWIVVMPCIAIGTFMFLHKAGVINIGAIDMPYPLFALIGLTTWQLFSTGVSSGTGSLVAASAMIAKINFPREVLILASMAQSLFEFGIKFLLIISAFFFFRYVPSWKIVFFPFALLPLLTLTIGLSFVLSLINGVVRDAANIVTVVITFLMFLTPVLYPIASTQGKYMFFKINLLTPLINAPRDLIVYGHIKDPLDYAVASVASVIVFLMAWRIFHLAEMKIPERL